MRLRGDWELAPVCHDQAEHLVLRGAKHFQSPEHVNSGAELLSHLWKCLLQKDRPSNSLRIYIYNCFHVLTGLTHFEIRMADG